MVVRKNETGLFHTKNTVQHDVVTQQPNVIIEQWHDQNNDELNQTITYVTIIAEVESVTSNSTTTFYTETGALEDQFA